MKKIVFLDIETTGLDPFQHEILEVGMIKRPVQEGPPFVDQYIHFSLGINPNAADPKALEVNRYHERRAELQIILIPDGGAETWLRRTLEDAIVVGNNVQFDLRFIERFFQVQSVVPDCTPWFYHPVDIKALVAGRLGMGEPPWSTADIARESGVPIPDDAHSAFWDAAWNRDVYDTVMNYEPLKLPNGSVNPPRRYSLIGGISENFHPEDY